MAEGGMWGGKSANPLRESKKNGCLEFIYALNRRGVFPFTYHSSTGLGRKQHYKATAAWSALASFTAMLIYLSVAGFRNAHDAEHDWYDGLDSSLHRLAALIFLVGATVATGFVMRSFHKCIEDRKEAKKLKLSYVHISGDDSSDEEAGNAKQAEIKTPGGSTSNPTRSGIYSAEGREQKCHPGRLFVPFTHNKGGAWTSVLVGVALFTAWAIDPTWFNTLAKTEVAHYGALSVAALATAGVTAGLFTLTHLAGAKIHDCFGTKWETVETHTFS